MPVRALALTFDFSADLFFGQPIFQPIYFSATSPQSRRGLIQFHGQNMIVAGVVWQGVLLVMATVLGLTAAKSRQCSALQNLTFAALIPPSLLQVPQAQYPAVAGLTHLAAAGVDAAAQTARVAMTHTGKRRFLDIFALVR